PRASATPEAGREGGALGCESGAHRGAAWAASRTAPGGGGRNDTRAGVVSPALVSRLQPRQDQCDRGAPDRHASTPGSARGRALRVVLVLLLPREERTQVATDRLDRVSGTLGTQLLELRGTRILVVDEALREGTRLD